MSIGVPSVINHNTDILSVQRKEFVDSNALCDTFPIPSDIIVS